MRWFTKNWANTHEPSHTDLSPLTVPLAPDAAADVVKKAAGALPRWRVESESLGELKLTRRTRLLRFVDDVTVSIQPAGSASRLHAASKSRVGVGDLGQNRRNILELWGAIRTLL